MGLPEEDKHAQALVPLLGTAGATRARVRRGTGGRGHTSAPATGKTGNTQLSISNWNVFTMENLPGAGVNKLPYTCHRETMKTSCRVTPTSGTRCPIPFV